MPGARSEVATTSRGLPGIGKTPRTETPARRRQNSLGHPGPEADRLLVRRSGRIPKMLDQALSRRAVEMARTGISLTALARFLQTSKWYVVRMLNEQLSGKASVE